LLGLVILGEGSAAPLLVSFLVFSLFRFHFPNSTVNTLAYESNRLCPLSTATNTDKPSLPRHSL